MEKKTDKKVAKYNFKRPDRISKNQIRSLHFVHDRFARNFSSSLSAYLRMVVEISLEAIEQVSYADFLSQTTDPTCYSAISLRPLDGLAAIDIGPDLVFPIIDRLLGGSGQTIGNNRPITEIEQSIMQNVLRLLVDNLKESWRPVYAMDFSVSSLETNPHMVQVVAPNEMVVHFKFQVRMRNAISRMHLAFPTLVLEPIIHIFDQEWQTRKKITVDNALLTQVRSVPVNVSIETGPTNFPMQSLLSLQAGDTLVLDQRMDFPAQIRVAGKHKLQAKARFDALKKTFVVSGTAMRREEPTRGNNPQ
jgi:flagellar motor switch protein FliM